MGETREQFRFCGMPIVTSDKVPGAMLVTAKQVVVIQDGETLVLERCPTLDEVLREILPKGR